MKCLSPQGGHVKVDGVTGGKPLVSYPCGYCLPCRITKRQTWTFRMLMEARCWKHIFFVTLTYPDWELPPNGWLCKDDVQLFMKRLRRNLGFKIRYFIVGEYGGAKHRPHYHGIFFTDSDCGVGFDEAGHITESAFHNAWYSGAVIDVRLVPTQKDRTKVIRYVAGYTLKKLTNDRAIEDEYGDGRPPEFALMSRRPGIGLSALSVSYVASAMLEHGVAPGYVDIPNRKAIRDIHMVRYDGKKWPIGREYHARVIDMLGGDNRTPYGRAVVTEMKTKLRWRYSNPLEDDAKRVESEARSAKIVSIDRRIRDRFQLWRQGGDEEVTTREWGITPE